MTNYELRQEQLTNKGFQRLYWPTQSLHKRGFQFSPPSNTKLYYIYTTI